MSINQLSLSLIKRNVAYRGPRTSDSWNDTIDEIATDLAAITSEWNSKLHPLLAAVPDGTDDVNVDAFLNGLDGTQLYTDSNATSTSDNGELWSTTYSRPLTVKETIDSIKDEVESNYNDLAALISDTAGVLTHDQKRAIGLEIFDEDYSFTGISILSRSQTNEYNVNQLAKDLYGTASVLDGDGISHFGVGGSGASVNDALTNILAMHGGTWTTDISLVHDIINADVNANADIAQTKLSKSGAEAIDNFTIGNDPVNILGDLNVMRTVIKILKGTATWTEELNPNEPYAGAPVTLSGHITNVGAGTASDTNPHGLNLDDLGGADLSNIRLVLGIDASDTVPPYADFPEGVSLTYLASDNSVTEALAKLDEALDGVDTAYTAHAASTSNPHSVTAAQITAAAIVTEVNGDTSDFNWARISKTGSDLADLITRSHTDLTDIGTRTHTTIDTLLDEYEAAEFVFTSDSRLSDAREPLSHGNEKHTVTYNSVTDFNLHKAGYTESVSGGPIQPTTGEHYATDIEVEDFYDEFDEETVEMVLHEINTKVEANIKRYVSVTLYDPSEDCATGIGLAQVAIGDAAMTLVNVHANVTAAGVTGTMTIDVNVNGTTTMTTDKLDVLTTATADDDTAVISSSSVPARGVITFDVDSIHSGTAAQGLTITLELEEQ